MGKNKMEVSISKNETLAWTNKNSFVSLFMEKKQRQEKNLEMNLE
jgi:hypothetical protein